MNWKIGDRAMLVNCGQVTAENKHVIGEECVLIAAITWRGHDWDVDVCGAIYAVDAVCLKPIPDDKSTWAELEKIIHWNPQKIAVESNDGR